MSGEPFHPVDATSESSGLAAMLRRRRFTLIAITSVAILFVIGEWMPESFPNWSLVLAALVYVIWGAVRERSGYPGRLMLQAVGLIAFGAIALVALSLDEDVGRLLLAAGWLGHAAWDVAHHRADEVVPRWYAEWCAVVDVLVAVAVLFMP